MVTVCRDSGLGAGRKVLFGVHHLFSKYLLKTFCGLGSVPGSTADRMSNVLKGGAGPAESEGRRHIGGATERALMAGESSSQ